MLRVSFDFPPGVLLFFPLIEKEDIAASPKVEEKA